MPGTAHDPVKRVASLVDLADVAAAVPLALCVAPADVRAVVTGAIVVVESPWPTTTGVGLLLGPMYTVFWTPVMFQFGNAGGAEALAGMVKVGVA